MSTSQRTLRDELRAGNDRAEQYLRSHVGMSFRTFKLIKALTQLIGMLAGIYAMHLGSDPTIAFLIMAFIWGGPEVAEHLLETADVSGEVSGSTE